MKFRVGDRVRLARTDGGHRLGIPIQEFGRTGTVTSVRSNSYMVKIDGSIYGSLSVYEHMLDSADEEKKIVITACRKKTSCKFYEGGKLKKETIARCSPEDTFDFTAGAMIAFERMVGTREEEKKPEPKYLTGKVVCTHSESCAFKVGKIYEAKSGVVEGEYGVRCTGNLRLLNCDEPVISCSRRVTFLRIKEDK